MLRTSSFLLLLIFLWTGCSSSMPSESEEDQEFEHPEDQSAIKNVSVQGDETNYTFSVTIESPDTGCEQYADWWEVLTVDSTLLYRRILAHSHVDEQPFTRSGGPVSIDENQFVFIRAHMNNLGFGTRVFSGSVSTGFEADSLRSDYASSLAIESPLPSGCAF